MKKFLTFALCLALLAVAVLSGTPSRVNAQNAGLISSIISRMERNRRDLRSMRANISMEKYNSQLRDSDRFRGQVAYIPGSGRNSNVRIDWQSPNEMLAVSNGQYMLFRPRLNVVYTGSATSRGSNNRVSGVLGFGLNVSRQQLASQFETPQLLGEETLYDGTRTTHMRLVPRGTASYQYAEIWVDGSGMPVMTKVVERNDDSTTVHLTNIQRNVAISNDVFHLQIPDGVRRVRG